MTTKRLRLALLLAPMALAAQSLAEFEKRITEFTLANGMHFIVLERRSAPVASFHLHVDAGAVDDLDRGAQAVLDVGALAALGLRAVVAVGEPRLDAAGVLQRQGGQAGAKQGGADVQRQQAWRAGV